MIRNISVGIDIGTSTTRVVVSEFLKGESFPRIIGTGICESKGVRHGYIHNSKETTRSIRTALIQAENASGIKIKKAFVSIGGITLSSETSLGEAIISKSDNEVTNLDTEKARRESEKNINLGNKKIIASFPISYTLDGEEINSRPEGLKGIKLAVKSLIITCLEQHLEDLLSVVAEAGVEPIDVIASPLAASEIAITERQKNVGCALVNIGAETVSISVFEKGKPISLHVFSIGSSDITNDIALGLKIPLEEAEELKVSGFSNAGNYSKKKLDDIIEARLEDIFELIEKHLKKIGRNGLLPAGIIFTGGGAALPMLENFSKETLKLPSKVGTGEIFGNTKTRVRDSSWFVALGLCMTKNNYSYMTSDGSFDKFAKDIKQNLKSILKQLLP